MTHQEARRIVEASTRFEVRDGSVWLRELRWLRAVERQRSAEAASPDAPAPIADTAAAAGAPRTPPDPRLRERQPVPAT